MFHQLSELPTSLVSSKHKATEAVSEFPFQIAAVKLVIGKKNPKYRAVMC